MMVYIMIMIMIMLIMLSIAFFTLLERKILSYIQYRKGPNKIGFIGILQPFSDGLKLFSKEMLIPNMSNTILFFLLPLTNMLISFIVWVVMPYFFTYIFFNMGLIMFLCLSSISVYSLIMSSWSSNSNYSMMGSLRSVAQMISYEISLFLILMSFLMLTNSFSLYELFFMQKPYWFIFFMFPISVMWLVSCLAETNRTPFDFSEGESELVSGFNIEFSSIFFVYLFLSEYCSIMFMCMLTSMLMLGGNFLSFFFFVKSSILCFLFIWVRGSLPRFRYDKLMYMNWKIFLPISIIFLFFYSSISLMLIFLL